MNKYADGKIYSIRSHQTDKYYIGSTCSILDKRLYQHKKDKMNYELGNYHFVSSFEILEYEDAYIELIELFSTTSKSELQKREGELIRLNKNDLVNLVIPQRTREEYYEDNNDTIKKLSKEYYENNKEKIKIRMKEYCEDNKDKIKDHRKNYYQDNKDKMRQQMKKYRNDNKEKLKIQRKLRRDINKLKTDSVMSDQF
jgi:hypothetical protein